MSTIASFPNRASLAVSLVFALGCEALALALALHHPLSPLLAVVATLAASAAAARWWTRTPVLLLALLPWIGLAPWSGWITFEELDILVLACAAGGYLALGLRLQPQDRVPSWRRALSFSAPALLLMAAFAASLALAMQRGFDDAGGFVFGWFQGYHEPMNSVRLAKSFFEVLLLLPLWVQAGQTRPQELSRALLAGMALALAGIGAAAVWERSVNTGLLNFSSDYRTTALFWEMHVGGAALDGALALTVPFVVLALLRARRPSRFVALLALAALAVYVCLTTFSRGVYAAVPLGLVVMALLLALQRQRAPRPAAADAAGRPHAGQGAAPGGGKLGALLVLGGYAAAALFMFETSGYRGLMALLGTLLVLLAMPPSSWRAAPAARVKALVGGLLAGLVLSALGAVLADALPKGAYVVYAVALAAAAVLRTRDRPGAARPAQLMWNAAAWFWLLGQTVLVARFWGGPQALAPALACVIPLALLWPLLLMVPALWPLRTPAGGTTNWRSLSLMFAAMGLVVAVIAVLAGGDYMRTRMSTNSEDLQGRIQHWKEGYWMLNTDADFLLGKGTGRYVASHYYSGRKEDHVGDYHLRNEAGEPPYLVLTGGQHVLGWGEMFRITQRVSPPQGQVTLVARLRAAREVRFHSELCEKHLLYSEHCLAGAVVLKPQPVAEGKPQPWQDVKLALGDGTGYGAPWYWPKLLAFSVALDTEGGVVEIGSLDLRDERGTPLLANGDFSQQMSHWFFSSDRHHMPWHIKNLGMHVLFDQGWIGLTLFGAMLLLALWRCSFGHGRDHLLAPALAGSLVGFVGVGAFDSLIDAPRVAFMYYVVLAFALGLRAYADTVARRS